MPEALEIEQCELTVSSIARLKSIVAHFGLATGAMYLASRTLRRFCPFLAIEKYYVVAQPTTVPGLLPGKRGQSISVLIIDKHHPLLCRLPRSHDEIARRLASGALCFMALRGDEIIGHLWVTRAPYREPVHRAEFVPLPSGRTAWDFDMWIAQDERLGFAFARLWDECNRDLRERGVVWTCSRVSAFNAASLGAHRRLGMRIIHRLLYVCAGPVELLIADVAPYLSISVSARAYPVIAVIAPASECTA